MIVVYSAVIAVMISLCLFGRLIPVVEVRIIGGGTLVALFIIQAALRSLVGMDARSDAALVTWSIVMLSLSVVLYRNRATTGMPLVLLGVMANLLVVVANDGMPIVKAAFSSGRVPGGFYHLASRATNFGWLGDVLPDPTGRWLMSLGDLLLIVGAAAVIAGAGARGPDCAKRTG